MPIELLLTAGPTREPIDHVRFLSNRSSGQLGVAVASEAVSRHWNTTLLLGTGGIDPPAALAPCCHPFDTTDDLQSLLGIHTPKCDILIMAAAVADFIPRQYSGEAKLSRHHGPINLTLDPAPDLIAQIATQSRPNQTIVGFALESSKTMESAARAKLDRKGLDAIVANPLKTMDAQTISAMFMERGGDAIAADPDLPKTQFASWLLDQVAALHERRVRGVSSAPP